VKSRVFSSAGHRTPGPEVTTFSIISQAASEGSTYPQGRVPASRSSRSRSLRAPKALSATFANDTVARARWRLPEVCYEVRARGQKLTENCLRFVVGQQIQASVFGSACWRRRALIRVIDDVPSQQFVGCRATEQKCPCSFEQNGVSRSGDRIVIESARVAHGLVLLIR
jgi:hypothetical protein